MGDYDLTEARKNKIRENLDARYKKQDDRKAASEARKKAKRRHPVCASCRSTYIQLIHGYEVWDYMKAEWVHWGSTVIKCGACGSTNASPQWVDDKDYLILTED